MPTLTHRSVAVCKWMVSARSRSASARPGVDAHQGRGEGAHYACLSDASAADSAPCASLRREPGSAAPPSPGVAEAVLASARLLQQRRAGGGHPTASCAARTSASSANRSTTPTRSSFATPPRRWAPASRTSVPISPCRAAPPAPTCCAPRACSAGSTTASSARGWRRRSSASSAARPACRCSTGSPAPAIRPRSWRSGSPAPTRPRRKRQLILQAVLLFELR